VSDGAPATMPINANQEGNAEPTHRPRPRSRGVLLFALVAIVALWAVGQIYRDDTPQTAMLFYAPSPAIALLAGIYSIRCAMKRRRWRALAGLALMSAPLAFVLFVENRFFIQRPPPSDGEYRLVFWNVQGHLHRDAVGELLAEKKADLYVFTEIPSSASVERLSRMLAGQLGSEYSFDTFGELAVIGRGSLVWGSAVVDLGRFKVWPLIWTHDERQTKILVVDLPSELNVPRDPLLRIVNDTIAREKPDIVVGDFNAPRRSRALSELPAGYAHAYDSIGRDWGYTWPVPAPLLAIDQCIYSESIVPRRYTLESTWQSDHRIQILDYDGNGTD
jgi:vancomycin resistance protein VanJ